MGADESLGGHGGVSALPWMLGLALVVSYRTLVSLAAPDGDLAAGGGAPVGWALLGDAAPAGFIARCVEIAVCLALALLAGRLNDLSGRRVLVGASCFACVAAALAHLVPAMGSGLAICAAMTAALDVLGRAGAAVLWVAWIELYARMDLRHVLVGYLLVHMLSAALSLVAGNALPTVASLALATVLPVISVLMLPRARRSLEGAPFAQGERVGGSWSFPVRPVALMAAFTLANVFVRSDLPLSERGWATAGVVVACLVVLAVALLRGVGRFSVWSLYDLAFPLTLAGLFGALLSGQAWGVAASLCTNAGFALFQVFMTAVLCNVSFRYGVSALLLFGFSNAASNVGNLVGTGLAYGLGIWPANGAVLAVAAVALVLTACFVAMSGDRGSDVTWGVGLARGGRPVESPEALLAARCACLSREYGLTRREEEVLGLLAQDRSAAEIAGALCVSNPTVKTHTQGVYRKLGVHSRAELVELVRAG